MFYKSGVEICSQDLRVLRVLAQAACRANSESAKYYPQKPIAFEGMPTDGLLASTVCLSPALEGSLGDADVAHVVGNMEDESMNI